MLNTRHQATWQSFLKMLAIDSGLRFVINANVGPATDGATIWLPELPIAFTKEDQIIFEGNAFHEVGHKRKSNLPFFQAFSKKHGPAAQFILNALDDVFMEGGMSAWKRMAESRLRQSTSLLIKRKQFRDGRANLAEAVGCYALTYLTAMRWPEVGEARDLVEGNLRMHLGVHADAVVPAIQGLLDAEFPAVKSTEDAGALTLKLIELLKNPEQKPDPNQGNDDGEGNGKADGDKGEQGEKGESKGNEGNQNGDNSKENGAGAGSSDQGKDGKQAESGQSPSQGESSNVSPESQAGNGQGGKDEPKGEGQGKGGEQAQSGQPSSQGESSSEAPGSQAGNGKGGQGNQQGGDQSGQANGKSMQQLVGEMLMTDPGKGEVFDKSQALVKVTNSAEYLCTPKFSGIVIDPADGASDAESVDGMPVVKGSRAKASILKQQVGNKSAVYAARLRALLENVEEAEVYSSPRGRLNDRNLYRFALDDNRIFDQREDCITETAAISVLLDLSGSTSGSVELQIRIAATLLSDVLTQVGTPHEVVGFGSSSRAELCMVKSFTDSAQAGIDAIAAVDTLVGGGTPTGRAVQNAGFRLLTHDSQRKLLIVVTDGRPESREHASEMTAAVEALGIEVIYLVIGPKQICDWLMARRFKFVQADDAQGLFPALVSKVGEFLK